MKKITLLLLMAMTTTFAVSQELDDDFLDSLPESIKDDVLDKVKIKGDIDKPVYRNASTKIDKESLSLDDEEYANQKQSFEKPRVFGEKFFDTIQTSFMPINEPNLDASYILDFGDVLEVQLIGQESSNETYPVRRDGSINISDIGKVFVSGLSLGDAGYLIKARVKDTFIGTMAFVSLSNIRDIGILVSGNAYNPGIYTLNGNSNMLHALTMAGGMDEIGSYREISLIRDNEVIQNLDVYDVLIYGKSNFNSRLRSGDSILVKPAKKIVSIESGVLRPGIYELKENETFSNLIDFANGLHPNADIDNIILKRAERGISKVINIDYSKLQDYEVKRGDSLFIREYKFNTISIKGAVKNPGTYVLPLGTKLSELIITAGGYEDSAYPFGGFLNNQKSLEINEESKERLYDKFLNNIIRTAAMAPGGASNSLGLVLKQLKDSNISGRVIAEFDLDLIKANPSMDTILEDKDEILVPNITQQVFIQGEVSNPGAIRYSEGKNIDFYIKRSGGVLDTAETKTIFIIHPNGETENFSSNSKLSFVNNSNKDILIYPGSIIYVPKTLNPPATQVAAIWAPIISSIALSLTSLSVLNNN